MNHQLPFIHIYKSETTSTLNFQEIHQYLKEKFKKVNVDIRDNYINHFLDKLSEKERNKKIEVITKKLAQAKIHNLKEDIVFEPLPAEIEYEKKIICRKSLTPGIIYDGTKLLPIYIELLPENEFNIEHLHIIFTNRLIATFDEVDKRYHLRVSIYSYPSIISTTGIVEAPAKPKEYYLIKNLNRMNILQNWKEEHKHEFIDYDDERLTEVMKGYIMQALFFYLKGSPFCNDKGCRLFNSHFQEEVIYAQLNSDYEFCPSDSTILNSFKYEDNY